MGVKADLFNFLVDLPATDDPAARKAFVTATGYPNLSIFLDWQGSNVEFFARLLDVFGRREQAALVEFLAGMGAAPQISDDRKPILADLRHRVAALDATSWQQEFVGGVAGPAVGVTPGGQPRPIPRVLPPRLDTPLLGRDAELSQAQARLEAGGKVYFYGAYGVGKTSTAAELYRRMVAHKTFTDGCLWERVPRLSVEKVLDRVAGKFAGKQVAEATSREEKILALGDLLAGHDLLIALDEVEDRAVAQAMLEAAGDCPLILSGTQRLNLAGAAAEQRLQPLTPPQAEELFKSLARPTTTAWSPAETALVTRICERMRRLPLAVKLAALKYAEGTESLQTLYDRLASEPETLLPEDGVIAIFTAQHTDLKQAPTVLNLLIRIAGFPALEAPLEALQAGQPDFYTAKDKLVGLGLVDYTGPGRLALHPLLGNQVQRVEPDAVAAAQETAAAWLMDYAARNREDYKTLEAEQSNLLALLERYTAAQRWDDLIALLGNLFDYLRVRGQWEEAFERLDAAVAAGEAVTQVWSRGWAYLHRGIMHSLRAEYDLARADFDQADLLFEEVGDQAHQGKTLYHRARVLILQGALTLARFKLELALAWMGDAAPRADRAGAHERLASLLIAQGEPEAAQSHYEAALALGDAEGQARAHIGLGQFARQQGDFQAAETHFTAAGRLIEAIDDVLTRAALHRELGYVHYYQGRYDEAQHSFEQAGAIFTDLKYQPGLAQVRQALGNVALARNQLDAAADHYRAALEINQARGQAGNAAYNRYQLGVVAHRQGQAAAAREQYLAAAATARAMGDVTLQAAVQHQLASLALAAGDLAEAQAANREALRLARQGANALTETSARYYQGLLELRAGDVAAGRQTLTEVHTAFVALNSPEADKVAALLAELDAPGAAKLDDIVASADKIHVIIDQALKDARPIDVITDGTKGIRIRSIDVTPPDIDVIPEEAYAAPAPPPPDFDPEG